MRLVPTVCSVAAAMTLTAGLALLPAASAHAALLGTITCEGSEFQTYGPSLTSTPTSTYIATEDSMGTCVSTDTSLHGGIGYTQATDPTASCDTLLATTTGQTTFIWSDGYYSTFDYTSITTNVNGELVRTETGTIVGGYFEGNIATLVAVLPTLDLSACQSGGISNASGSATLEILPL